MNLFRRKKKKLTNELTMQELNENFAVFQFERERLHAQQIAEALELSKKHRVQDYVR
jgi:uncharacterized small protein (DUF1192 family)